MKKPFLHALVAAVYIALVVSVMSSMEGVFPEKTIFGPMAMLGLFVLSVAVMGFLFFYEPLHLFLENNKHEGLIFFGKTIGFFACFVAVFFILIFLL